MSLCDTPREPDTARAENAAFLIEFYQRTEVESLSAPRFLTKRIAAVVAGMGHVVVLQPAFPGLIANGAIDRMVEQEKLHRVADRFVNSLSVGADFHVIGDGSGARWHELWIAFDLYQTHAATAFDSDVGMVAISWDLDADLIGHLDDRSSFFGLVHLAVDCDLGHKRLD